MPAQRYPRAELLLASPLLATLGCTSPGPPAPARPLTVESPVSPPPIPPASSAPTPAATTEPEHPPDPRCVALLGPAANGDEGRRATCTATATGVWALVLDRPEDDARKTAYTVRFAQGAARLEKRGEIAVTAASWSGLALEGAAAFDFDGDGAPEYFVQVTVLEAFTSTVARFFLTARGAIRPYPPAARLPVVGLEDEDGDGRPDALVSYDLGVFKHCMADSFPYGITVLAHSLPDGTFSTTDAAARAWEAGHCAAPPHGLLMAEGEVDVEALACARFWGVSGAAVRARVTAFCGPSSAPCTDACPERALYDDIAAWKPPFTLR